MVAVVTLQPRHRRGCLIASIALYGWIYVQISIVNAKLRDQRNLYLFLYPRHRSNITRNITDRTARLMLLTEHHA